MGQRFVLLRGVGTECALAFLHDATRWALTAGAALVRGARKDMTADKALVSGEQSACETAPACDRSKATCICWHHNLGMGLQS